jgi:methylmalonyl-CoA/ethylmalonyl-CoA epimerase
MKTQAEYLGGVVQVGVVVEDIEKTCANLERIFGIGPWEIRDWPPRQDMRRWYRGQKTLCKARMAFCLVGTVELEIIQPLEGSSIWRDFLTEKGEGIHHIRFNVEDEKAVQAHLQENHGIKVLQHGDGIRPGTVWMNFDTIDSIGFVLEIMRQVPGTDGLTPK